VGRGMGGGEGGEVCKGGGRGGIGGGGGGGSSPCHRGWARVTFMWLGGRKVAW